MSFVLLGPVPIVSPDGLYPLCPLVLHERQVELDDLELDVQLAKTRLEVSEELFVFLDGLWGDDSVADLDYLQGKHHLERDKVELERARQLVKRQQAILEQSRLVCSALYDEESESEERRALQQAYRRYREADCEVRALDIAIAEVNLEHHRDNLESILNLRRSDIASRQEVILVKRDVDLLVQQIQQAQQRVARCHRDIAKQWGGRPE